jgi:membrane protease YdiL (CAAX protease family)
VRSGVLLRLAVGVALALALLVLLAPAAPAARLGPWAAAFAGALGGLGLYLAVARCRPYAPPFVPAAFAAGAVLVVSAASEEVVWRRVVLGELLRAGPLAALAGSALGFAVVHRARQGLHLGTGAAFGGLYLATGALAASITAHSSYNVLLLILAERRRRPEAAP